MTPISENCLPKNEPDLSGLAVTPAIPQIETPNTISRGSQLLREKIEVGREILKMMNEQQQQNIEYARQFSEIANLQAGRQTVSETPPS